MSKSSDDLNNEEKGTTFFTDLDLDGQFLTVAEAYEAGAARLATPEEEAQLKLLNMGLPGMDNN